MCPSMAKYSSISSTMVTPRSTLWIACSSCLLMPTSTRQDLIDLPEDCGSCWLGWL